MGARRTDAACRRRRRPAARAAPGASAAPAPPGRRRAPRPPAASAGPAAGSAAGRCNTSTRCYGGQCGRVDRQVWVYSLVDHAVADDDVVVVPGRREQRVPAVEGHGAHRAAVQPQRLVRLRRQLQVEPATHSSSATHAPWAARGPPPILTICTSCRRSRRAGCPRRGARPCC